LPDDPGQDRAVLRAQPAFAPKMEDGAEGASAMTMKMEFTAIRMAFVGLCEDMRPA
jgi:hypothetical protein